MVVFALGGTSYGMAEESLAFYALVITVMVAAGYDSLTGAALILLGCGIGVIGSTINPFATGIASGFAGRRHRRRPDRAARDPRRRHGDRHLVRDALRGEGQGHARGVDARREPDARSTRTSRPQRGDEADGAEPGNKRAARSSSSILFFLAFVVMIIGVIPWSDLGISFLPRPAGGGSPR